MLGFPRAKQNGDDNEQSDDERRGKAASSLVYEPNHGELYVFNHGGNSATVIDAKTDRVVTTIPLGGAPEFAAVDSAGARIYCNVEDTSEVVAIDNGRT